MEKNGDFGRKRNFLLEGNEFQHFKKSGLDRYEWVPQSGQRHF